MAILALAHWPKASVSGRLEPLPSSFMRWKTGDSLSFSRIQIEPPSRIAESRNGMRQPQLGECGFAHPGADAEDQQQRHEQPERGGGLDPRRVEAALVPRVRARRRRSPRRRIRRRAPDPAPGEGRSVMIGRSDAPRGVGGQDADEEGAQAHQRHGDEEGVFAADQVAEAAEEERAERPHGKTGGEGEQREDECRRRMTPEKKYLARNTPSVP